jgi:hypothetical protein
MVILFLFVFSSCDQFETTTSHLTSPTRLVEYDSFLNTLFSQGITSINDAKSKYVELFEKEEIKTKDRAFLLFLDYYDNLNNIVNNSIENVSQDLTPFISKDLIRQYKENGFVLDFSEGESYFKQDRDYLAIHFYKHISSTLKKYLEQLNKESKEGFLEDASILITPEKFSERLAWWDTFIENNPDFCLLHKAKENRKILLTVFIKGVDNTPLFDSEKVKLTSYYQTAYETIQNDFAKSTTNKLLKNYFDALKNKDIDKANFMVKELRIKGIIED